MIQGRRIPPLTSILAGTMASPSANESLALPSFSPANSTPLPPAGVSDEDAKNAIKTLLRWLGEDTSREGLKDTPDRVLRAWEELFAGYAEDPSAHLETTFQSDGFQDMVCLTKIPFTSYCEHHIAPFSGFASVAYIPRDRITGLSKLARVVDGYAKRLQLQERLTTQIAEALQNVLNPLGVAVAVEAEHHCLCKRGAHKEGSSMFTIATRGLFAEKPERRAEFMAVVHASLSKRSL